ncbi:MAG TPA: hypothetical protein VJU77_08950 [Chthoniobacterales bacterium]|nr:hypothetical protein [Chthoniobacterales bacterium]
MSSQVSLPIEKLARDFNLEVHGSPFHAAEGLELRKQSEEPDILICVGYILGPDETDIYRRLESKKDIFRRNWLSFLYGWLIKPRPRDAQHRTLRTVPSSEFTDQLFVTIARDEFKKE